MNKMYLFPYKSPDFEQKEVPALFRVLILGRNSDYTQIILNLIDWKKNGFSKIVCATKDYEAYIEINAHVPDLIVIDAQASCMSQLTFLYKARETHPYAKIILITAEKDFAVAQAAFDLHVDALLIWSELNSDILLTRVQRIHDEMDESIHRRGIVKRQLFRDILKGKIPTREEIAQYFEIYDPHAKYVIIRINRDSPYPVLGTESFPVIGYYAVNWHGSNFPPEFTYIATVNVSMHSWCTLLKIRNIAGAMQVHYLTQTAAIVLQNSFKSQFRDTVSLSYSRPFSDFHATLKIVEQLDNCLQLQRYYGSEQINAQDDFAPVSAFNAEIFHTYIEALYAAMQNESREDAIQKILSIFSYLKDQTITPSAIRQVCDALLACLDDYCKKKRISHTMEQIYLQQTSNNKCYSTNDISLWFCQVYSAAMSEKRITNHSVQSQKVQSVIDYIEKNYANNDSVSSLAARLHISSDYLRHLFKDETGENITSFIAHVKVEKAKLFLRSGRYKISEVAQMVGFNTVQYFGTVFRKHVGCSPREYIACQQFHEE